jgi:small subunit ribosomal protein S2e
VTKLGRLVKERFIKKLEDIYLYSLPIKEYQIIDFFFGKKLKDEVMKIMPVQKQQEPDKELVSRLLSLLEMLMDTLVWELNALKKLPLLSEELSNLLSSLLFL